MHHIFRRDVISSETPKVVFYVLIYNVHYIYDYTIIDQLTGLSQQTDQLPKYVSNTIKCNGKN